VRPDEFIPLYRCLNLAIERELVASVHGVFRGGLAVHLAMVVMGGNLGMNIDLESVPAQEVNNRDDIILFAESAGRFVVTLDSSRRQEFETTMSGCPLACVGTVTAKPEFVVRGLNGEVIVSVPVQELKASWKKTFAELI
jgi:phosphoribosylformylglycinamidine synthase subunit PurSL